jgi:protein TonB
MAGLQQTPVKERLRALDALDRSLADTRLINLDARAYFEWLLACTLAEGWRPGHEVLFVAVAERFDWVTDQHRLAQFGRAGHFINNAINERLNYDRQSARAREDQRQLILQLRQTEHPGQQRVITNLPHLEHLIRSYPHWLGIIAPVENIQRWREWDAQVPKWRRRFTYQSPAPELASAPEKPMSKKFSWALMLAVLLMSVLGRLSHNQNQSQSPTHRYVEEPSANWQRPSPASVDILDAMSQPHTQPPGNLYPGLPPVSDPLPAESTAARAAPAPAPVQPQTEPAVPHRPYSRETSAALYPELDTTRHFLDPVMPPRPAPAASLPAPIYHLQDTHHDAPEGGPIAPVMPPTDYSLKPAQ